MEGQGSFAIE